MVQPHSPVAKRFHLVQRVRTKQHRGALRFKLHDALKRLLGKRAIAHTQCFVNDQNIRIGAGGNGKSQAHIHAAGIRFNRLVNELTNTRKFHNAFVQSICFRTRKAHHSRRQIHILAARKFWVKARAQFQQRTNFSIHNNTATARVQSAAHHLQQGRFACAIAPHQT